MNIQRSQTPPSGIHPVKLTSVAYLDMRAVLNAMFERTELLDGWIYEMPADGTRTRLWNRTINEWLMNNKGPGIALVSHQTLPLGGHWAPSPDHYLFPENVGDDHVSGPSVLLVIEVSDTTLEYDLGGKADAYAKHGVGEYWVVDPNRKEVFVHLLKAEGSYGEPVTFTAGDLIEAQHIPGLKLRLADLPRINN